MLLKAGFVWLRSKGSHRIYAKAARHAVIAAGARGVACGRLAAIGELGLSRLAQDMFERALLISGKLLPADDGLKFDPAAP
jgi:hypothetical protein